MNYTTEILGMNRKLYYILYFSGKSTSKYNKLMTSLGAKFGEDNTYFFEFNPQDKIIYDRLIIQIIKRHIGYKNRCYLLVLLTDSNDNFDFKKYIVSCEKEELNFFRLFRFADNQPAKMKWSSKILLLLRKHKFFKFIVRS